MSPETSRTGRDRTTAHNDRREKILAAALSCFVTDGFHGTAVPQVARAAKMATGTMYHYFASKEVLVNALYRKWKETIGSHVLKSFPPAATPREQFRAMWFAMLDFALTHPDAFAFLEFHHHRSYLDAESLAMENRLKEFGALIVQRAQSQGAIKAGSTSLLMEMTFGAFNGMIQAHRDKRIALTEDERDLAERAGWDAISAGDAD